MRSLVSSTESNALTITIGGTTAAGVANGLYCDIDGYRVGLTTTGGHTPAQAASAYATAIDAALPATYTVTVDGATITVSRVDGGVVTGCALAKDSGLTASIGGWFADSSPLLAAVTAGTGRPNGYDAGHSVRGRIGGDDGAVIDGQAEVVVLARLVNEAGTAKTAYFNVWGYTAESGWMVDSSYSAATVTNAGTAAPFSTLLPMPLIAPYDRVAVELIGSTATGTDLTGCFVDARILRV